MLSGAVCWWGGVFGGSFGGLWWYDMFLVFVFGLMLQGIVCFHGVIWGILLGFSVSRGWYNIDL